MPVLTKEFKLSSSCKSYSFLVCLSFPLKLVWFVCLSPKEEYMSVQPVNIDA